jgi:hypothetical protein
MPSDPGRGSKFWEALDGEIGKPGKYRSQIVAHWEFQSTAAFHDRKDRRDFGSRLRASNVDPILPTESNGTHGVLRQVIAQLQFGIFQEPVELFPQRQRVVAGLGQGTTGQCRGACRFNLFPNPIQQRSRLFLT